MDEGKTGGVGHGTSLVPGLAPVSSRASLALLAILVAVSLASHRLPGDERLGLSSIPEYKVGDLAIDDVVVPSDLALPNLGLGLGLDESTDAGRLWVYRRDLETTARVVEELQRDFVRSQDRFRAALVDVFGELPVSRRDVNSVRFRSLQAAFQNRNEGFPVSYQLAVSWAYELDDSHFFLPVSLSVFESFVGRAVIPDGGDRPSVGDQVLIVPAGTIDDESRPVLERLGDATLIDGNSVDQISGVRERVYRALAGESLILAGYVSRRLQPNAEIDNDLTNGIRLRRGAVEALSMRLAAGAILVRKGERITEEKLALLADLDEAVSENLAVWPSDGSGRSPSWLPSFLSFSWMNTVSGWSLGFALALLIAFVAWIFSILTRNRSRLPAVLSKSGEDGTTGDSGSAGDSILVHALRNRTVQALYSQHREFLAHERSATELLKEFEQRIASLEPRTQDKIRRYEARINELEQQLADKEAENRELIQRQIENTRREIERELSGVGFENN